jgi:hypothetical protein
MFCVATAGRGERVETNTILVRCEVFSVENCIGKTNRHIWDNDIEVGI